MWVRLWVGVDMVVGAALPGARVVKVRNRGILRGFILAIVQRGSFRYARASEEYVSRMRLVLVQWRVCTIAMTKPC